MDIKKEDRQTDREREREMYEYIIKRFKIFQPVKIHTSAIKKYESIAKCIGHSNE